MKQVLKEAFKIHSDEYYSEGTVENVNGNPSSKNNFKM